MPDVGEVRYAVALDNSNIESDAQSTGQQIQSTLEQISGKLDRSFAYSVFKDIGKAFIELGQTAINAVKGIGEAIGQTAEYGDNIDKMSQKMGLSAQAYQEWDAILQHSGTSIESMQASMKTLASAAETNSKAFEQLGISQEQIANMSQEELFGATITALQNVGDETERTYLAGQLLGRGATELGALLNTSAEDTEAMRQRVHELGGVMSDEAVKAAAAYQDSLQDMNTAIDGAKRGLIEGFMPAVTQVMDGLTAIFSGDSGGVEAVTEGINAIVEQVTSVAGQIGDFVNEHLDEIIEIGTTIFNAIIDGLSAAFPVLLEVLGGILGNVLETVMDNGPAILEYVLSLLSGLIDMLIASAPSFLQSGIAFITNIITGIAQQAPTLLTQMVTLAAGLISAIVAALPDLLKAGIEIITTLLSGIVKEAPNIILTIGDMLADVLTTLTNSGPDMLSKGIEMIQNMVNGIISNLPAIINAIVQVITTLLNNIAQNLPQFLQKGIELLAQLAVGVIQAIPQLVAQLPQIFYSVMNALASYDWLTLGWNIVVGLANGITSGAYNIWNALVGAVQSAWDSVLSWLGIHSPSTRARDEIGKRIPQGAAQGIEEESDLVTDAMVDTYKTAFDVAEQFTSDIAYNVPDVGNYAADLGAQLSYASEQTIIVPVNLDGREIARVTAPFMGEQLAWEG